MVSNSSEKLLGGLSLNKHAHNLHLQNLEQDLRTNPFPPGNLYITSLIPQLQA